MKNRIWFLFVAVFWLVGRPVYAETTLTVATVSSQPGDTVFIPISADTPQAVAAAAFTIKYNPAHLSLDNIQSAFFRPFSEQWQGLSPVPDPLPPSSVSVGGQSYSQPFVFNHDAVAGTALVAAANVMTGSNETVLFTLQFSVSASIPDGFYPISIFATNIDNTAAGYPAAGTSIPLLTGMVGGEADPAKAYPVLPTTIINGAIAINVTENDTDGDGIDDAWEIEHFGNLNTADAVSDWDEDGYSDRQEYMNEQAGEMDPANQNYDPKVYNAPGGTGHIERYTVGGNIGGIATGNSIVVQNNGGDDLAINADGSFTFTQRFLEGSDYQVTVLSQPTTPKQTCTVSRGVGTIEQKNVTDVDIVCVTNTYTVGGSVSGLVPGNDLVLQNNLSDDVTLSTDGEFTFVIAVEDENPYEVTVYQQPQAPVQLCTVSNATGVISGGDVSDVQVLCDPEEFPWLLFLPAIISAQKLGSEHSIR